LQTRFVPQPVPAARFEPGEQVPGGPEAQLIEPDLQTFGSPTANEQVVPLVQEPQVPLPSQTWFVPQLVPAFWFVAESTQVWAPVWQLVTPALHLFGLVEQARPAVQLTHAPVPLQTRFVPQPVPADLLLDAAQTGPDAQDEYA
jgi:hypothetical protein